MRRGSEGKQHMDEQISKVRDRRARASAPRKINTRPNVNGRKIAVLVAGMHRSGTSLVTRILSILGCDLPQTLVGPGLGNELGHWESEAIRGLNEEILASAGSAWDDWEPFNPGWSSSAVADEFRERAQAALQSEFGDSGLFVLKDPRVCRLLMFWIEAVEIFGASPRPTVGV